MSQLFLFTGLNDFALRAEKKRWMREFQEKHGQENLLVLDGMHLNVRSFRDEISAAPFVATKRLLLIEGIPRFEKDDVQMIPLVAHPGTVILFVDPSPDKRFAGVKELLKIATVKEFTPLRGKALRSWMTSHISSLGAHADDAAYDQLLETVGEDQSLLASELEKLALFAAGRSITKEDVLALVIPSGEQEVWMLTNLLAAGKSKEALSYAKGLLERGTSPQSLWAILLWMLECLTLVSVGVSENIRNPAKLASALSVPFPTARTLLPVASSIDPLSLEHFVQDCIEADIHLKTGGYRATAEAPEELLCLIDRFILQCPVT